MYGQKASERIIRPPFYRWRSEPHLQRATVLAFDCVAAGAWVYPHTKQHCISIHGQFHFIKSAAHRGGYKKRASYNFSGTNQTRILIFPEPQSSRPKRRRFMSATGFAFANPQPSPTTLTLSTRRMFTPIPASPPRRLQKQSPRRGRTHP